ncbi:MAG: hypothetical protein WCV93_01125 [Candidatus Shapirobacteria bacterium]|jgi:hypothetical protein
MVDKGVIETVRGHDGVFRPIGVVAESGGVGEEESRLARRGAFVERLVGERCGNRRPYGEEAMRLFNLRREWEDNCKKTGCVEQWRWGEPRYLRAAVGDGEAGEEGGWLDEEYKRYLTGVVGVELVGEKKVVSGKPWEVAEAPIDGPRWRRVAEQLEPILNHSSGGSNCVPEVATWWVALARGVDGTDNLERLRNEVMADVARVRQDRSFTRGRSDWLDSKYLYRGLSATIDDSGVGPGRLGDTIPYIDFLGTNGFSWQEPQVKQLERVVNSADAGRVILSNFAGTQERFWGHPVIALNVISEIDARVVITKPENEFFREAKFGQQRAPRVGEKWTLIGAHYAMIIGWDEKQFMVLDPQTGMVLGVNRDLFNQRLKASDLVLDGAITIDTSR